MLLVALLFVADSTFNIQSTIPGQHWHVQIVTVQIVTIEKGGNLNVQVHCLESPFLTKGLVLSVFDGVDTYLSGIPMASTHYDLDRERAELNMSIFYHGNYFVV